MLPALFQHYVIALQPRDFAFRRGKARAGVRTSVSGRPRFSLAGGRGGRVSEDPEEEDGGGCRDRAEPGDRMVSTAAAATRGWTPGRGCCVVGGRGEARGCPRARATLEGMSGAARALAREGPGGGLGEETGERPSLRGAGGRAGGGRPCCSGHENPHGASAAGSPSPGCGKKPASWPGMKLVPGHTRTLSLK